MNFKSAIHYIHITFHSYIAFCCCYRCYVEVLARFVWQQYRHDDDYDQEAKTRTSPSQTLINNIFSSNIKYESLSGNLTCRVSDHLFQLSSFSDYHLPLKKPRKIKLDRSFKNFRKDKFIEELSKVDYYNIVPSERNPVKIDVLTQHLLDTVTDTLNVMVPVRRLTSKGIGLQEKPWMTIGILKSTTKRDQLYKQYLLKKLKL